MPNLMVDDFRTDNGATQFLPGSHHRRSIQGAYIRRDAESGADLPARMTRETLARISPLAKHVLAL